MAKKEEETAEDKVEEEADVETDETEEVEESDADDTEEKSEEEATDTDNEIDFDAEIEKEKKGKPDPELAKKAFKKRSEKREEESDEDSDDDKPMTRREMREMREMLASNEKKTLVASALQIAKTLSTSDKEAQLIIAKWENRTFPSNLSLTEQVEEMYAVVHRKKLIGERNEAVRALKNKGKVNSDGSGSHRDSQEGGSAPKIAPDMKVVIAQSKLVYNTTSKRYERKLPNGDFLVYDVKSKQIVPVKKAS